MAENKEYCLQNVFLSHISPVVAILQVLKEYLYFFPNWLSAAQTKDHCLRNVSLSKRSGRRYNF